MLITGVKKRWLKVYCQLEQMLIIKTMFVIFMIIVMNDVFISFYCSLTFDVLVLFSFK